MSLDVSNWYHHPDTLSANVQKTTNLVNSQHDYTLKQIRTIYFLFLTTGSSKYLTPATRYCHFRRWILPERTSLGVTQRV